MSVSLGWPEAVLVETSTTSICCQAWRDVARNEQSSQMLKMLAVWLYKRELCCEAAGSCELCLPALLWAA